MQYRFGNMEVTSNLDKSYASRVERVKARLKSVKENGRKDVEIAKNNTKGILSLVFFLTKGSLNLSILRD